MSCWIWNMSKFDTLLQETRKRLEEERTKPFIVSVMGQTGVGKSSLINALFGTEFETDPVRPCTKEVQAYEVETDDESTLRFLDLPGLGEAGPVSQNYLDEYVEHVKESDVVVWAVHADVRSVAQDETALEAIVSSLDGEDIQDVLSKMTFVMTKADLIMHGPWVLAKDGDEAVFAPTERVEEILREKARYLREVFIDPYAESITSETFNDGDFDLDLPGFYFDEFIVGYEGMLSRRQTQALCEEHPRYADTFHRLFDNHRVIPCSSYLRYNLYELLLVVLNKLGEGAIVRFENFLPDRSLNRVPFREAMTYSNFVYLDRERGGVVFNPREGEIPTWWNDG